MIPLKLGTRASPLALAQTNQVIAALAHIGIPAQAKVFSTRGDMDLSQPLYMLGDKGLFTAELEAALRSGEIDAAVHSAKDMSALDDPDLPLVAALARTTRADILISHHADGLAGLPNQARVGTSSLRRAAQLKACRSDLVPASVRGNVQTRLKKWQVGEVDALILAAAGLERLGLLQDLPSTQLDWDTAPAQGIIAIQGASQRVPESAPWNQINDYRSFTQLQIERALVRGLGAHCRLPVSCFVEGETVRLSAWLADGREKTIRSQLKSIDLNSDADLKKVCYDAESLGQELRKQLPPEFWSS